MSGIGRHICPHRVWRITVATLFLVVGGAGLSAHKVAPDPTVEIFLRATRDHLAVKVWLPMVALGDANLPRTPDGHLAQDQIRPALDVVARGLARDLELQQGDTPLSAPSARNDAVARRIVPRHRPQLSATSGSPRPVRTISHVPRQRSADCHTGSLHRRRPSHQNVSRRRPAAAYFFRTDRDRSHSAFRGRGQRCPLRGR